MTGLRKHLCVLCLMLFAGMGVAAQTGFGAYKKGERYKEETEQRWAIDAHIGGNAIREASLTGDEVPLYRSGSTSQTGLLTRLRLEYYIPYTPFSVKLGYEHEECAFLKDDATSDLHEIVLGGRWYPAPGEWSIQPYAGADVLWAVDAERGGFDMASSMGGSYGYHATGKVDMPRFSVSPVVGADFYMFSCVAIQLEYGYRFGLDSHYRVTYTESSSSAKGVYHGQIHRHVFSVGLKITFPFTFTGRDFNGLLDGIIDSLLKID